MVRGKECAVQHPVVLRMVVPGVPKDEGEKALLEEDLQTMGCHGLLKRPWCLKNEEMVRELITARSNEWEHTLRREPEDWTSSIWRGVYNFPEGGEGLALRTDRHLDGKFANRVNRKDGFALADCKDARERRVLEFLVPILYPEKPTRVTFTMGNTLFGALSGERKVDWSRVIRDVVQKLVFGMTKPKPTLLCPYIFHLYHSLDILREEEIIEYQAAAQEMFKYDISLDLPELEVREVSEHENLDQEEIEALLTLHKSPRKRLKKTYQANKESPPIQIQREQPGSLSHLVDMDQFWKVVDELFKFRDQYLKQEELSWTQQKTIDELKEEVNCLQSKAKELKDEVERKEEEAQLSMEKAKKTMEAIRKIQEYIGHPGDISNLAKAGPVSGAKVVTVFLDYASKMERIFEDMRSLFVGLEPEAISQPTSLDFYDW